MISQNRFAKLLRSEREQRSRPVIPIPDVERLRGGLPMDAFDRVKDTFRLSQEVVEQVLGVSTRTLQRRRKKGDRLTPTESDRLWRLIYIYDRALAAFESRHELAHAWLTSPHALLDGEQPLARLDTEPGMREVEDMLTVIDETAAA